MSIQQPVADLAILSHRHLLAEAERIASQRDHLAAAMRAAIEEIDLTPVSRWTPGVVKQLLTNALNGMEHS